MQEGDFAIFACGQAERCFLRLHFLSLCLSQKLKILFDLRRDRQYFIDNLIDFLARYVGDIQLGSPIGAVGVRLAPLHRLDREVLGFMVKLESFSIVVV
jgi:hypothetical protein